MIKLGETYKDMCGNDVRIICVDRGGYWPVVGLVDNDILRIYTAEGKLNMSDESPYDLILPEDYSTYKIDEPVMVWSEASDRWLRRYFAGVRGGKPYVFCGGATSWSMDHPNDMLPWNQCRRPTKEELGEGK